jgi:prepilin peptidase dependent protein B
MLTMRNIQGFTFTELMVALTLNAILFVALIGIFIANISHYKKTMNENRLNLQLESALIFMANDIRRAGYWANSSGDIGTAQNNNPFMVSGSTDITVSGGNCILFTYDHGSTGALPAISSSSDDYRYGFKLSNNAIQARPQGAGFTCGSTDWENITDTKVVTITALSFNLNTSSVVIGPGTRGINIRSVDISVTGQLASDATVTKTLSEHVRIRNDKFIP